MDWNTNLKHLMGEATQLVRSGHLADATRTIQQALGGTMARHSSPPAPATSVRTALPGDAAPPAAARAPLWRRPGAQADVEDVVAVDRSSHSAPRQASHDADAAAPHPQAEPPGSFTRIAFAHPGTRNNPHHYHLYVPPGAAAGAPMPLVLMLHGCTQNPEDFATGTGMNAAAALANTLVLYPEQPHSANSNGCWNWFRPGDQQRGGGEPALLVAMVQDVMNRHAVDTQRVYVAGLSAGGAMAALLGREYPDVFAAVGVHSGLQAGAAHNVMGALSAMKNGAKPGAPTHPTSNAPKQPPPPIIVFHGDADTTVHAHNGEQLIQAQLSAHASTPAGARNTVQTVHRGQSPGGRGYTCTVHALAGDTAPGAVVAEHWVLHGAGHAWAGGHAAGSHTDPHGVGATAEMLRFFGDHRLAQH